MNFFIKSHIVKKGETLDSIAELYDIPSVDLLRNYHNNNCELQHLLGWEIRAGQEIYIPTPKEIDQILTARASIRLEKDHQKTLQLENDILKPVLSKVNAQYHVTLHDTGEKEANTTEYDITLRFLNQDGDYHIISYDKRNYLLNGEVPDTKVYDLALLCSACLYPMELKIDSFGKIIGIENFRKIRQRWQHDKTRLKGLYEDEYSLKYIEDFGEVFYSEQDLWVSMRRDLFLQFCFSSFYTHYTKGRASIQSRFLPQRVLYENTYDMEVNEDDLFIRHEADGIDPRDQQQILARIFPKEEAASTEENYLLPTTLSAEYRLDKATRLLEYADININTNFYGTEETTGIVIVKN